MKEHAQKVIDKIEQSNLDSQEKNFMMEKLRAWREDENAANDVVTHFEELWVKLQPFFREAGLL